MIDITLIREKPDWVKEQITKLNDPDALKRVDAIVDLDKERRTLLVEAENIQAERNRLNKAMGMLRGNKKIDDTRRQALAKGALNAILAGDYALAGQFLSDQVEDGHLPTDAAMTDLDALMKTLGGLGEKVEHINGAVRDIEARLDENLYFIPNIPHASVPVFDSEDNNIPHPPHGVKREFDFEPKAHWDLGPALGIIDFERGVKLAGSRGYMLRGLGARLQRALITFFLNNANTNGFEEVYVPYLVKEEEMYGSGQFPKFRDVVYYDPEADRYLLPTAEVAIANMHRDETFDEADLPLYYVGHTPCFRREKMSAGRDVRGIKRVHQFEKVEMFKFTTPETSYDELETLTQTAENLCDQLGLHYRRLEIVTGDLGFSASKKYDVEVWSPGCQEWLEVSSCSNTEDFQARRANIKYRAQGQKKPRYVHTLNGSGLAVPRIIIAILENYQQADGSVIVPEVLRPYLGGLDVIRAED